MKNVKQSEKLEKRIDELLKKNVEEIKEIQFRKDAAAKERADVVAKLIELKRSGNLDEFKAAQKRIEEMDAEIALCEEFLDVKQSAPLVSEEEYTKAYNAIMEEHNKVYEKNRARVLELFAEIESIAADEESRTEYENAIIRRWQRDIYRNNDCPRGANGAIKLFTDKTIYARPFGAFCMRVSQQGVFLNLKNREQFVNSLC